VVVEACGTTEARMHGGTHSPPFRIPHPSVHVSTTLHRTAPHCTACTALHCAAPHRAALHHTAPHQVPPHNSKQHRVAAFSLYLLSLAALPRHVAAVAYHCCIRAQALCGSIRCPPGSQGMSWVWAHPSDLRCAEKRLPGCATWLHFKTRSFYQDRLGTSI